MIDIRNKKYYIEIKNRNEINETKIVEKVGTFIGYMYVENNQTMYAVRFGNLRVVIKNDKTIPIKQRANAINKLRTLFEEKYKENVIGNFAILTQDEIDKINDIVKGI